MVPLFYGSKTCPDKANNSGDMIMKIPTHQKLKMTSLKSEYLSLKTASTINFLFKSNNNLAISE